MRRLYDLRLPIATVLTLAVGILGLVSSLAWVANPFPGFLVLENRVVASAGLARWPAVQDGEIYQAEILSMDGVRVDSIDQIQQSVRTAPVGTPIRYVFEVAEGSFERTIETRIFGGLDYVMLFAVYLLGGLTMCGVGLGLLFMRRGDLIAEGTGVSLWIIGMWALTAMDLYGPYHLFRLHAGLECLLFAACLHLAVTFPYPHRMLKRSPRLLTAMYGAGGVLAVAMQGGLHEPSVYGPLHRFAICLLGLSLAALILSQLHAWLNPPTFEARQRVKVLMFGIVLACLPNLLLSIGSVLTGGRFSENAMGWSGIFLPLSIAYAVLRTNLFEVDTFLRRTLNYGVTSMVLTGLYAVAIFGVNELLQDTTQEQRGQLLIATSALALFALLPLRDRLQTTIDRLFFRNVADLRRIIDATSEHLASVADLDEIVGRITSAVREGVQPEWVQIEVFVDPEKSGNDQGPSCMECFGEMPEGFFELREMLDESASEKMLELDRALGIPVRVEGRLVARTYVGPRRSGRFFDGEDRRFLRTLCNQGGIAIENALAIERLRKLNQSLEQKVDDRTQDLTSALSNLRETQDHLVHQEKLASVGRLVAGIAHEINNPVNFVNGNLVFLREHVDALKQVIARYGEIARAAGSDSEERLNAVNVELELDYVTEDLESIFAACQEGLERTTTIISDLKTFSRSDSARYGHVHLEEAIDSTLSLLRGRLTSVEIVRDFEDVPPLCAVEGQIKQVLMNLVDNALDAMDDRGTLTLRLRVHGDRAIVEVEDEGPGIAADTLEHIFDPFFTTKAIGKGTGLGLAISYGVIVDHGGSIRVNSEPGQTCFTFEIPLMPDGASEARPA